MSPHFVDRILLQNRLFAELSRMFGIEVPLYDRALLVNRATNEAVCEVLCKLHRGFHITAQQLERTSGERHGAIRIGRPDEYRWVSRFFGVFGMEPHNFYGMTALGPKSQPIIATAFRSVTRPEHRVFTSLLMTDYYDDTMRARLDALLAKRTVFSDRSKELIERCERQGGLSADDGEDPPNRHRKEINAAIPNRSSGKFELLRKPGGSPTIQVCFSFATKGECKFARDGKTCTYSHDPGKVAKFLEEMLKQATSRLKDLRK